MELTTRQLDVARVIHDYVRTRSVAPSFRDIAAILGISAPTVAEIVAGLEARGALTRNRQQWRTLRLTPACEELVARPRLRVEGQISAGAMVEPGEAVSEFDEDEILGLRRGRSFYLLEVRGDSMIGRGIHSGDFVLMEKTNVAKPGDVVAALDEEGQATLKIYRPEKGRIKLEPANPAVPPIYVQNVRIQGVLRTVIRRVS